MIMRRHSGSIRSCLSEALASTSYSDDERTVERLYAVYAVVEMKVSDVGVHARVVAPVELHPLHGL